MSRDKSQDREYIYMLSCFYWQSKKFVLENNGKINNLRHINCIEKLKGIVGKGKTLYILPSAVLLPEYLDIITEAKIRDFKLIEVNIR